MIAPNLKDKRHHKIKSDYGIPDYYKHYKIKCKDTVDNYQKFSIILNAINQELANKFASSGYELKFPKRMGMLCIGRKKGKVWFDEEGNLKTNRPVNWKKTLELWATDESARTNKVLIRFENKHSDGFLYKIFYRRSSANYKNKSIYLINPNRELSRMFANSIKKGNIETVF